MPTSTPNLALQLPADGEANWGAMIRNDMTLLDTAVAAKITATAATAQFAPISYSSKAGTIAANTALTAAQCRGQSYTVTAASVITLPLPGTDSEVTIVSNIASVTVAVPAGIVLVLPDGQNLVAGSLTLSGADSTAIFTSMQGVWFVTAMSGNPIVKPATAANQAVAMSQAYGIGQTWQNVVAARALGTVYTNTTGKAIMVLAKTATNVAGTAAITATIAGLLMTMAQGNNSVGNYALVGSIVVPPGMTYVLNSTAALSEWYELR